MKIGERRKAPVTRTRMMTGTGCRREVDAELRWADGLATRRQRRQEAAAASAAAWAKAGEKWLEDHKLLDHNHEVV